MGTQGPDLYMLLQPLLVTLQLAAALLLLAHAGLQLCHHQLQLLLASCQPAPRLFGLRTQLCLCSELLRQAGALLFQLGTGWEVSTQQAVLPGQSQWSTRSLLPPDLLRPLGPGGLSSRSPSRDDLNPPPVTKSDPWVPPSLPPPFTSPQLGPYPLPVDSLPSLPTSRLSLSSPPSK